MTSKSGLWMIALVASSLFMTADVRAQEAPVPQPANYVIGSQDVLVITSYDQPDLTGKFTVETDGSFTYPLIGRMSVAGMALREVESTLEKELIDQGYFVSPELTVAIEQYRSQRIYIVGEVRTPGAYSMSGDMRLVEALALAGSTLSTASGEVVIVRAPTPSMVVKPALSADAAVNPQEADSENVVRVDVRDLETGDLSQNAMLRNGDTIFVLRAENVYVFGQVKNPGAYSMRDKQMTVLQTLALAGGVSDRGSMGRCQIVRIVDGKKKEIKVAMTDFVEPGDTIVVPERFF